MKWHGNCLRGMDMNKSDKDKKISFKDIAEKDDKKWPPEKVKIKPSFGNIVWESEVEFKPFIKE